MSLLGVDVGTTGCKAAAYSLDGRCLVTAYREYAPLHPQPSWTELDSRAVAERIRMAIAEVASKTNADPITALCASSMGEAMTPVTQDGRILGNSIVSSVDTRGGEYLAPIVKRIGKDAFYAINPNIPAPVYSLPSLLWYKNHSADMYGHAWKFLLWGDMVAFLLGCEPLTSFSLANRTLLFDIRAEKWSSRLLEASGIDASKLPKPAASGTVAGVVSSKVAAELGLPKGVKVVVGGHDQCCSSLGAGIYTAGRAVCGLGTFECITPTYGMIPEAKAMQARGLNVEHHVIPGLYVSFIYNQSGSLVRWFRDTFASVEKQAEGIYRRLDSELPEAPTRIIVLPYFEPSGAPQFVTDASGVIAGLKMNTTRGEIFKAIMESVTFYFVDSLETLGKMGIDTSGFVATGGGAKSDRWLQIKADIFGVPFMRPRITECGTVGCAILAGTATGLFKNVAEGVSLFVKPDRTFEPDASRNAIYRGQYGRYRELFKVMRPVLSDWNG